MQLDASAIVAAVRAHGEHGAVVRLLTAEAGLIAGYVRGARSRRMRPVLIPGNVVAAQLRARTHEQLGALTVELEHSRAGLMREPLAAAAMEWSTLLTASLLPEGLPVPTLHAALSALLDAIAVAPAARGWAGALARYELLLLGQAGFGLRLDRCIVTGATDELAYVSPRSAAAVSRAAAIGYEARLLPLPAFLLHGGPAGLADALAGLMLSGHFVAQHLGGRRGEAMLAVRERLIARLNRAVA